MTHEKCKSAHVLIAFLLILISDLSHSDVDVRQGTRNDNASTTTNAENKPASPSPLATAATHHSTLSAIIKPNEQAVDDYQADAAASDDANYVFEDMDLLQNDQPNRRSFTYGGMRKHPPVDRRDQHQFAAASASHRDDNILYTKEVHIRQGAIKGIVRTMHAQSGLKSVDQYLGIPYAAPPTGSGRFMPPGK